MKGRHRRKTKSEGKIIHQKRRKLKQHAGANPHFDLVCATFSPRVCLGFVTQVTRLTKTDQWNSCNLCNGGKRINQSEVAFRELRANRNFMTS